VSLSERVAASLHPDAKVVTLDIETQRGVWSAWGPVTKFLPAARCLVPPRILCIAAKWANDDKLIFRAAWDDNDSTAYERMLTMAWKLLNDAHAVVTYNGDRFDLGFIELECGKIGLGRPVPYKSIDLYKVTRKFTKGATYKSLDWSARQWLRDSKITHGGSDLWDDIRYGTRDQKRAAQKTMREYCCKDVELTERLLLEAYLPWTNINVGLFRQHADDDQVMVCTKCGKEGTLNREGMTFTGAFGYRVYRCSSCKSLSRGKRAKVTTELRGT